MNVDTVEARIDQIREVGDCNPEIAHEMEDQLFMDFIEWVAEKQPAPAEAATVAKAVMKVLDLDFPRWYA